MKKRCKLSRRYKIVILLDILSSTSLIHLNLYPPLSLGLALFFTIAHIVIEAFTSDF